MSHPFDLNPFELETMELDFEQQLTDEEAARVGGGQTTYTTLALGEEGGDYCYSPKPQPLKPRPFPAPPEVTTKALGEEGGDPDPPIFTTLALGEEGGCFIE